MDTTVVGWTPRAEWTDLPGHVQTGISDMLGSPVVAAVNQSGGFSPGLAARVRCADGTRAFVKAVGPELNEHTPGFYRQEAAKVAQLPPTIPAPALLATYDDGAWVALVFDEVDGAMPAMPWTTDSLNRVVDAIEQLAIAGTPNPIAGLPAIGDVFGEEFRAYVRMAADPPDDLDAWERRNIGRLAALVEQTIDDFAGDTLGHLDIRADNLLIDADDRVYFVDWPWGVTCAPWVDTVGFLVNAALYGHDPEPFLERSTVTRDADPRHITGLVAALAGTWAEASRRPAPPGLPTLRDFQRAQHDVTLAWLRQRTNWD